MLANLRLFSLRLVRLMKTKQMSGLFAFAMACSLPLSTLAQGTAFTYQGRLLEGANPATGSYESNIPVNRKESNHNTVHWTIDKADRL